MPGGSCKYRRYGVTYWLHHQGDKNPPILVALRIEAIRFSETSVLTRITRVASQKMAFSMLMNLQVLEKTGDVLTAELVSSAEKDCSPWESLVKALCQENVT
jgi:cell division FtsZ-interacting protein ZapD